MPLRSMHNPNGKRSATLADVPLIPAVYFRPMRRSSNPCPIAALTVLLAAAPLAFPTAASAQTSVECAGVTNCRTIGGPWDVVPPEPNVGANNQITATWLMTGGPDGAAGIDWVSGTPRTTTTSSRS
jgi:hypothetical protein